MDEILDWKKQKEGIYVSTNERFKIEKSYSDIYGEYWKLTDNKTQDRHYMNSLTDAKARAECIQIGVF